jgi:hypothetical protein
MDRIIFVKKCDQHGFGLGLLQTKLLGLGDDSEVHCMLCRLINGSYRNTHDSSPVKMQPRKLGLS